MLQAFPNYFAMVPSDGFTARLLQQHITFRDDRGVKEAAKITGSAMQQLVRPVEGVHIMAFADGMVFHGNWMNNRISGRGELIADSIIRKPMVSESSLASLQSGALERQHMEVLYDGGWKAGRRHGKVVTVIVECDVGVIDVADVINVVVGVVDARACNGSSTMRAPSIMATSSLHSATKACFAMAYVKVSAHSNSR